MAVTVEPELDSSQRALAAELHELEAHEAALERRTRSLELAGPLALILSLFALALGVGGLVVALNKNGDTAADSAAAASGGTAGSAGASQPSTMMGSGGAMIMGAGGHGKFTSAQMAAAGKGTVYVQLGDFWAAPTVGSVRAGKVTFVANNVGHVVHELMVERMPMKFDAAQSPDEQAAQGMINDMEPGMHGRMTMQLKPGKYMLFCNVQGHYAAGQHMVFTVRA